MPEAVMTCQPRTQYITTTVFDDQIRKQLM